MIRLSASIGFLVLLVLVQSKHMVKLSYEEMREDEEQESVPMMELLQPLNVLRFQSAWNVTGFSWNTCGKPSTVVSLNSLTVTPDPVKAGGSVQVSVQGNLQQTLSSPIEVDVKLQYKVWFFWITVKCKQGVGSCVYPDICPMLPPGTCPIQQGPVDFARSFNVPANIPKGKYCVTANLKSQGAWLGCLQVYFDVSH